MGRDKALVTVDGVPLAARVARALTAAGVTPVTCVGGDLAALRAAGLDAVADDHPGEGPLGGILAALDDHPDHGAVVVLACDLVAPSPAAITRLLAAADAAPAAEVVVPVVAGRRQWLHAWWRVAAAPGLHAGFAAGGRSVAAVAEARLAVHAYAEDDPLADADAPGDLPVALPDVTDPTLSENDVPVVDVIELARQRTSGAPVVDVRESDEWEEFRVPGAALIPLAEVPDRLDEFPTGRTVYVVCRSGGRSAKAVAFLRGHGVDAVNVAGGSLAWVEAGMDVDPGPTG